MKYRKLAQSVLPVIGVITLVSGCASTSDLYEKYEDVCELPEPQIVERTKVVKEVVEKIKIKPVETIKYVDRVKKVIVPETKVVEKIKYVDKIKVVNKTKYVTQAVKGTVWEPAVYFGFDLENLESSEQARLDRDLLILNKNPTLKLSVQAFTDSHGSNKYNHALALKRQKTVVDYLVAKGLDRDRIKVASLGEELPILGETEAERKVNRRVELMLLDRNGRPLSLSVQP